MSMTDQEKPRTRAGKNRVATGLQGLDIEAGQARFREAVESVLGHARELGASDAAAEVSESCGLSVSVRKGSIETVEQALDRSLGVTVYAGRSRGSASTSDLSPAALRQTVEAAWHIARHTADDPAAGLPEADQLATQFLDLDLHHPWRIDTDQACALACRVEQAALDTDARITNTEGASVNTYEGHFVMGNTHGFMAGYPYSRHSLSVAPIAGRGNRMQRDYWYSAHRAAQGLGQPEAIGRYAAERTLARLLARRIPTGRFPVLFEAPLALGLIGALTQAVSGGALYRKASFLLDAAGRQILPGHIDLDENPFIPQAMGSAMFDDEGVATRVRQVVSGGVLNGYFLSSYTARKLGLPGTGNAGGSHNLMLRSRLTRPEDDFEAMLRKMGTGLLVTELIGQGVNYVTGDYSRGAFGYWVENGRIQHAVQEITIAGNLQDMFRNIVAVGADRITRGGKTSGSILIAEMSIAGI